MEYLLPFAATLVGTLAVTVVSLGGPRKAGFALLNMYRVANVRYLALTGRTPDSEAAKRVVSGEAWAEWCDSLKASAASLTTTGCPTDPLNQAEGYRYLTRLVRGSLESMMECSDPCAPVLVSLANGLRDAPVKLGTV